jgi:hypothetical protein
VDKPYCFSRLSPAVKNAGQEEEAKVGVMWLDGWPGLQLHSFILCRTLLEGIDLLAFLPSSSLAHRPSCPLLCFRLHACIRSCMYSFMHVFIILTILGLLLSPELLRDPKKPCSKGKKLHEELRSRGVFRFASRLLGDALQLALFVST